MIADPSETKPLLVTPQPKTDESLMSLLLRATEANGYLRLTWLTRAAGVGKLSAFDPRSAARALPACSTSHLSGYGRCTTPIHLWDRA